MLPIKMGISVIILLLASGLSLAMSHFFNLFHFFLPQGLLFRGETSSKDSSVVSLPMPIPVLVPSFYFDGISRNKSELQVYTRRKKSS